MGQPATIDTDILIIGGGIAGCIAAIALVEYYEVSLIDKLPEPVDRIGESLAPAAQRILKQLRLLENPELGEHGHLFLRNLGMQSYWGREQVHMVDYLRNPEGLGINLNRKAFEEYLRKTAKERGVNCAWPLKLRSGNFENSTWHITAQSGDTKKPNTQHYKARFVIDATGRQSHFARSTGVKRNHFDKLISCWASMPNHLENRMSTISASESGWWYSSVVPNHKRIFSFQTDSDLFDKSVFRSPDSFLRLAREDEAMRDILDNTRGNIEFQGTVAANSSRLHQVAGIQWAALGDAAISFDPLSSQGMFHAMASAMQLKELMVQVNIVSNPDIHNTRQFQILYNQQIDEIWKHYLRHKNLFYREEMRWKEAPFWKRRHHVEE